MVPFHAGVAAFGGPGVERYWVVEVAGVEQGDFGTAGAAFVVGFLADAQY